MIDGLYLAFLISMILFLWNHTDFFVEYCHFFGLWSLFKICDYEKYKVESSTGLGGNPDISYLEYLALEHSSFFVRLITCPICLSVWLNGVSAVFISKNFQSFALNLWLSLFLYFIIKLVMKKSDA